jgi:hypothetical protein
VEGGKKRRKEDEHEELDDDTDGEEEAVLDNVGTHRDGKVLKEEIVGRKEGARLAREEMSVLVRSSWERETHREKNEEHLNGVESERVGSVAVRKTKNEAQCHACQVAKEKKANNRQFCFVERGRGEHEPVIPIVRVSMYRCLPFLHHSNHCQIPTPPKSTSPTTAGASSGMYPLNRRFSVPSSYEWEEGQHERRGSGRKEDLRCIRCGRREKESRERERRRGSGRGKASRRSECGEESEEKGGESSERARRRGRRRSSLVGTCSIEEVAVLAG